MTISAMTGYGPDLSLERPVADLLGWARESFEPEAKRWIDGLEPKFRLVAGYQLGWWDSAGKPANAGGKAVRAALVLLCARAVGGAAEDALPAAVGVEFVHAFSLMHDDVMDRDLVRRHRPAAWTVFGTADTLAAADALMSLAFEGFFQRGECVDTACAAAAALGEAVARMARGQALDPRLRTNRRGDDRAVPIDGGGQDRVATGRRRPAWRALRRRSPPDRRLARRLWRAPGQGLSAR